MPENEFIAKVRQGDQEAAKQLFERHVNQLLALSKHRIDHRFASRVDPEDVVQSAFNTFFKRMKGGEFVLSDEDDMLKLLVRITLHKTLRQIAFHQKAKRDARQETGTGKENQQQILDLMAQGPTPEQATIFLDQLESFFEQLSPEDRYICHMRMEGHSNAEIAKALDVNERHVRRLMERLRGLAEKIDWMS